MTSTLAMAVAGLCVLIGLASHPISPFRSAAVVSRRRRHVAAAIGVTVLGGTMLMAPVASASTAWTVTATVTQIGEGNYTLAVEGDVPPSCSRAGAFVRVTAEPGDLESTDITPSGGHFETEFTGLPTDGPYTVHVQVVDGTPACTDPVLVTVVLSPPVWTDTDLPSPVDEDVAYSDGVAASGDPDPTYALIGGALPDGLVLDTTTGAITGTPTEPGTFTFQIQASNSQGSIQESFSITVDPAVVELGDDDDENDDGNDDEENGNEENEPGTDPGPEEQGPAPVVPSAPTPAQAGALTSGTAEVQGSVTRLAAGPQLAATGFGSVGLSIMGVLMVAAGLGMVTAQRRRVVR